MLYARFNLSLSVLLLMSLCACARDQERVNPGDTPPDEAPPAVAQPATPAAPRSAGRAASGPLRSGKERAPDDTNNASVLNNPDTAAWTAGLTAKGGSEMVTLVAVRTATHDEFERIVFAFEPEVMPGYKVEYIDRPVRQCGSGQVVELPGDAWLSIRLEPARAHTEQGAPTIAERARVLNYENIKALKLICDFEGQVEWVAAVASPARYRSLELRAPARLVIDVRK